MTSEEAIDLIREAVARFDNANIPWERSRLGIFGFWVGDNLLDGIETPLQRAQLSERTWAQLYKEVENPYACVVKFIHLGGKLSRWEHGFIDVLLSDGERVGVPEDTLRQAQRSA